MRMLVLAEKPSVAKQLAGIIKKMNIPDHIDVDSFHGHVMTLPDPDFYNPAWKTWDLGDLPIIPEKFQYIPSKDEHNFCKKLADKIRNGKYDYLVNACDAGREGDLIFYSFYWGHRLNIPVLRFWTSSTTDKAMQDAFSNLLPASNFYGYTMAAMYRARLDWLLGMNLSRAVSLKTGGQVAVGSVMTPTLAMIVDRELAIRNFKPEEYYEVVGSFKTAKGEYDGVYLVAPDHKKCKIEKKADANAVADKMKVEKTGTVIDVVTKRVATKAPTLYSLLELQKDGAKYFGYKANKTLEIAQALYETHKLISYPRSESRFLPTDMVPEIMNHVKPLHHVPELEPYVKKISESHINKVLSTKDYVDDAKLTDHHAIIPTEEIPNVQALTKDERNIYTLVCKRFLSIFMEPYVVDKTVLLTEVAGEWLKTNGKMEVQKGFTELYPSNTRDSVLPNLKKGDTVTVADIRVLNKETEPPKRYTTESILDAMQNAGSKLSDAALRRVMKESAGLGTSATRAGILEKLEYNKTVEVKKSTFYPTDFGIESIMALADKDIRSAELRAKWEQKFQDMEESNNVDAAFQDEINAYVRKETESIVNSLNYDLTAFRKGAVGRCPVCGKPVVRTKNYFLCDGYKKTCDFFIYPEFMGAKITDEDAKTLLSGQVTETKTLTKKDGTVITTPLVMDGTTVVPAFAVSADKLPEGAMRRSLNIVGKCPICGKDVYELGKVYSCSGRDLNTCQFSISKIIKGAAIEREDVKALLDGEKTETKTFVWGSGKTGPAQLQLINGGKKLDFVFK